jgi:signal transduction histidine kinase
VLRFKDHEDPERIRLTPVPSLSRVDELTDAIREAGLAVTLETCGPAAKLPPGVDLTAYRIIQEALTNAVRHAPGATACVLVTYEAAHVSVAVTNTARTPLPVRVAQAAPAGPSGRGYGLAGIAERVASCGGALSLGPTADGGFAVTARLPLT